MPRIVSTAKACFGTYLPLGLLRFFFFRPLGSLAVNLQSGKYSLPTLNAAVCASSQLTTRDACLSVDILRNRTVRDPEVTLLPESLSWLRFLNMLSVKSTMLESRKSVQCYCFIQIPLMWNYFVQGINVLLVWKGSWCYACCVQVPVCRWIILQAAARDVRLTTSTTWNTFSNWIGLCNV